MEVYSSFKNKFIERKYSRPKLDGVKFSILSNAESYFLEAPLQLEEIKEVVWSSAGDKSIGPDVYNICVFKICWEIVQKDIMGFINDFYNNKRMPKVVTASFIVLISKASNPQFLEEFSPICLVGYLYHNV